MSTRGRGNNFQLQSTKIVLQRDVSPVRSGYHEAVKHSLHEIITNRFKSYQKLPSDAIQYW